MVVTDRRALRCYLKVKRGDYCWLFAKHVDDAAYRASVSHTDSWRWIFAKGEAETIEGAIVLAFEKAAEAFPRLLGIGYDGTVTSIEI